MNNATEMRRRLTTLLFTVTVAGLSASSAEPKRVLVFSRCEGYRHGEAIDACRETLAGEAGKGRYAVDFSEDYAALKIENLIRYHALVLNNTTTLKMKEHPYAAPAICSFVRWGGGLCAIHSATDNFYDAPECASLVGGSFCGHPWGANGTWAFKVEDVGNPVCAPFKSHTGGRFRRSDEIYQQASPFYDRSKLHVLISLDFSDPATAGVPGQARPDGDYAVSWIRPYGAGRVFYTTFAHDRRAWDAADTRGHILAGLDYATGALKADDSVPAGAESVSGAEMSLADCVAAVFDRPYTGVDGRVREARYDDLGAALGRAVEAGESVAAVPVAKRVFAAKDLPEMLRACAARVLLAANPNTLARVLADPSRKVREAAFGKGLAIPASAFATALNGASPGLRRAILARLAQDGADCNAALTGAWIRASASERAALAEEIFRLNALGAFDVWQRLAENPRTAARAKKAYVALAKQVLGPDMSPGGEVKRGQWRATASRNADQAKNAIDGNPETRWDSGALPHGQWFALDLGAAAFVEEVVLDTEKSADDTPQGAAVYVSRNGADWDGPVAVCRDKTYARTSFRIGRTARHLKFVVTGDRTANWWSIHEIAVKAGGDRERIARIRALAEKFQKEVR